MAAAFRRALLGAVVVALAAPAMAQAQAQVELFRIVTTRDTVVVGAPASELGGAGSGMALQVLAARLQADGHVTLWSYASGRAPDGSLRLNPTGRVVIFRNDTLRIEPYAPGLPVAPPPAQ
jgi:hypothetical protein